MGIDMATTIGCEHCSNMPQAGMQLKLSWMNRNCYLYQ